MELRKQKEREFHNKIRAGTGELDAARSNKKFYSITRSSRRFWEAWLQARSVGNKTLLDFACGEGECAIVASQLGFDVTGIDISDVSIANAKKKAEALGLPHGIKFLVRDCEATKFPDNHFDVIFVAGVLHHLDLKKALAEMVRILKPEGEVICIEGLANNPLIQFYRRRTPGVRTEWEMDHILRVQDLQLVKQFFEQVNFIFFHLFVLAAVPFRKTKIFEPLLTLLEAIDSIMLRVPFVRSLSWQMVFTMARPNKPQPQA